jgi:hypothetical protein
MGATKRWASELSVTRLHLRTDPFSKLTPLEGKALVERAFGVLGQLSCRYLSVSDRIQLEALARLKLSRKGLRLNLMPFRNLLPGRLDGSAARMLVQSLFSDQAVANWMKMPRGDREDLQRLAVVKHAAMEQGLLPAI